MKKIIVPIHSNPTGNREFLENGKKKCKKLKKHHSGLISSQNKTRQADSDTKKKKKKVIVPIHSKPIWNKEFPKISKKM